MYTTGPACAGKGKVIRTEYYLAIKGQVKTTTWEIPQPKIEKLNAKIIDRAGNHLNQSSGAMNVSVF
jgi:hypothetical protein